MTQQPKETCQRTCRGPKSAVFLIVIIYLRIFFSFRESPPYYAYGLACLQFLIGGLYWTAAQKYANKVAPPSLVGTMTGIVGSVNWIIAKGDTKMPQTFFRKQNQRK